MKKIVILGHVDHGKSTILGRLLADTKALPRGKLERIRQNCLNNAKPFEYSFLVDALKIEQDQGITLDIARCFFKYKNSEYLFFDAPGHVEFLKNAVTGAFQAENAIVVIDIHEGIQENSRRHAYLLSMMNMENIIVLLNKMDLVNYDQNRFEESSKEYQKFLQDHCIYSSIFIPVTGLLGENIVQKSYVMPWYQGKTLLEALGTLAPSDSLENKPFRMPVQDVYKFTEKGDNRRIVAGLVESGQCHLRDKLRFLPSNKEATIVSFEDFPNKPSENISAGMAAGFVIHPQIYLKRGEIATKIEEKPPLVASRIKVRLYCFSSDPLKKGKTYVLKICTTKVSFSIEKICKVLDTSSFQYKYQNDLIEQNDVAECILTLSSPIAFDLEKEMFHTARFVIVDEYSIIGGGIINKKLSSNKKPNLEFPFPRFIQPFLFHQKDHLHENSFIFFMGHELKTKTAFIQNFKKFLLAKKNCQTICIEIDSSFLKEKKAQEQFEKTLNFFKVLNVSLVCFVKGFNSSKKLRRFLHLNNIQNYSLIHLNEEGNFCCQNEYHTFSSDNLSELLEQISSES